MTSDVQQTYYGWQHGELSGKEDSQGTTSISQVIDHGSISFGRFAIESLSWEKRSVFTHNERQEELEKFKLPGLVAKKKAYFEEYYKKIRALKAMQNQQTELSLEYGADDSISSQTGDDDEPALLSTRPNAIPVSISQALQDDLSVEVSFEKECSEAFEHENVGLGSLEKATPTKTIELHKCYSEVKQGGSYNNSIQIQIFNPESLVHSLSTENSEEIKPKEGNYAVKLAYKNDTKLKLEPDLTSLVCLTDPKISDDIETCFAPVDEFVQERSMLTSHKPTEDLIPAPKPKEPAASAGYISKGVDKLVSERIKSSLGSKHLLQKSIDKAEIGVALIKKASCKARSRDKCSFVASKQRSTDLKNKVIVSRPVPVSREKKGAIPIDTKESILKSSKVSIRSASGKFYTKGNLRVQGDSREMATQSTVKIRELHSKSIGHGEFEKNLENKCKTVERRATTEQLKSRSINLPSRNNHGPNGVISCHSGNLSCADKIKKATDKKYEGTGSKLVTTFQQSGNNKFDSVKKQVATTSKHDLSSGVRKSSIGGKNLRHENPRWR